MSFEILDECVTVDTLLLCQMKYMLWCIHFEGIGITQYNLNEVAKIPGFKLLTNFFILVYILTDFINFHPQSYREFFNFELHS